MSKDPLADALLGTGSADYGVSPTMGMVCTSWNPTTLENVVTDGAVTYTNLLCLAPTLMQTGRVLVIQTGGRPVILGPLYSPTVPPPEGATLAASVLDVIGVQDNTV